MGTSGQCKTLIEEISSHRRFPSANTLNLPPSSISSRIPSKPLFSKPLQPMPGFKRPKSPLLTSILWLTIWLVSVVGSATAASQAPATSRTAGITYYHHDLAGSVIGATDALGAVLWQESYLPYGERLEPRSTPDSTDTAQQGGNRLWFHGKAEDAESGLQYFGARYYDPVIGRFLSIDPAGVEPGNVYSFNRYAYGNGNPYRFRDPNGMWAEDIVFAAISMSLGTVSLQHNLRQGNVASAAVDVAGIVADGIAAALPGVPAIAGMSIAAARGGGKLAGEVAEKGESLIYRAASGTPTSMTPRSVDKAGLSATNSLENALLGKNQIIDTSKFKNLCAVCDNPKSGHVSIIPKDATQMQGWINSRGSSEVHPLTRELMDAVVGTVKK